MNGIAKQTTKWTDLFICPHIYTPYKQHLISNNYASRHNDKYAEDIDYPVRG